VKLTFLHYTTSHTTTTSTSNATSTIKMRATIALSNAFRTPLIRFVGKRAVPST
jgi:hypothetical protein